MSDATLPAQDDWSASTGMATVAATGNWSAGDDQRTIAATESEATVRADADTPAANKVENPARFDIHSLNGAFVQEYRLEKKTTTIGRVPESDLCFPNDMLVSRLHATIRYEDDHYVFRDEGSANGTIINSQPATRMTDWVLQDGDKIIIGDNELTFHTATPTSSGIEEDKTIFMPAGTGDSARPNDYASSGSSQVDEDATMVGEDPLGTRTMETGNQPVGQAPAASPSMYQGGPPGVAESPPVEALAPEAVGQPQEVPLPSPNNQGGFSIAGVGDPARGAGNAPIIAAESGVTASSFSRLSQPILPDMASLLASSSALQEQVTALQQQLNAAQEAVRSHEAEVTQTASQLRTAMRRLAERMDSAIAAVARSRGEIDWDSLLRLIQDTMSNPRDGVNALEFARRAGDVDKAFQRYQGVLNTLAECNSLLRSLIGDENP